ncbi:mitochondrial inner membrane protein-domain-containing protein [Cladochytrium replicatum]|nr:mitochondrial inner membrane protein-domain-containing protein [Cladochytrium replicatum]
MLVLALAKAPATKIQRRDPLLKGLACASGRFQGRRVYSSELLQRRLFSTGEAGDASESMSLNLGKTLRRTLYATVFLGASAYVGGAYYALHEPQPDPAASAPLTPTFRKFWLENIPLAQQSMDFVKKAEGTDYQKLYEDGKNKVETIQQTTIDAAKKTRETLSSSVETAKKSYDSAREQVEKTSSTIMEGIDKAKKTTTEAYDRAVQFYETGKAHMSYGVDLAKEKVESFQHSFETLKSKVMGTPPPPPLTKSDPKPLPKVESVKMEPMELKDSKEAESKPTATPPAAKEAAPKKTSTPAVPAAVVDAKVEPKKAAGPGTPEKPTVGKTADSTKVDKPLNEEKPKPTTSPKSPKADKAAIAATAATTTAALGETKKRSAETPKVAEPPRPIEDAPAPASKPAAAKETTKEDIETLPKQLADLIAATRSTVIPDQQDGTPYHVVAASENLTLSLLTLTAGDAEKGIPYIVQSLSHLQKHLAQLDDVERAAIDAALAKQATELEAGTQTQLAMLAGELLLERSDALSAQKVELRKEFEREIKERMDTERQGRLAKLDQLELKLKKLETLAIHAGDAVRSSTYVHKLWAAFDAARLSVHADPTQKQLNPTFKALARIGQADPVVSTVLSTLDLDALGTRPGTGVPSRTDLLERFYTVASAVRKIQLMPVDGGPLSYAISRALSVAIIRKRGMVVGDDVEAVLARAEHHLEEGDVMGATREVVTGLKGWQAVVARDWIEEAKRHLEIEQALKAIETRLVLLRLASIPK